MKTSAQAAVTNLDLQITEFTTAKDEKRAAWKTLQATYKKTVDEIKETLRRNKVQIEEAKKMAAAAWERLRTIEFSLLFVAAGSPTT